MVQRVVVETKQSFPIVETPEGPRVLAFNHYWLPGNDISIHLSAWREGLSKSRGGMGKLRHLLEAYLLIWPHLEETLHEWTTTRFRAFDRAFDKPPGKRVVSLAGGAGTAKSADAARFALLWWWANPTERTVLLCSTTIQTLKKRIWSYVAEGLHEQKGNMPGIMSTTPVPQILFDRIDHKHGIFGVALKDGASEKTLADLIGIHPKEGLLVIVDEATDVTSGVIDAQTNWDTSDKKFAMFDIGNSKSRLDTHGRLSEPAAGWNSVHPDVDEEWETNFGVCLYFDCYKSPAILADNKEKLQFLINDRKIKAEEKKLGKDHPQFWRFVRGFWPPEDLTKTVLTMTMIEKHLANRKAEWNGQWILKLGACDPAFTSEGDECVLRFADFGPMANGKLGVDFGGDENILHLRLDARSKEPINYQIIRMVRRECEARGVLPENFGIDTWGFGTGAGDIAEVEWSPLINRIVGIGAASDREVDSDLETSIKANEIYDRKTTELWFAARAFVQAGQVRGLDRTTIEQLCTRTYDWKGRRMCLESKKEYKRRMGKEDNPTGSPDEADAACIIFEMLYLKGLAPGGEDVPDRSVNDWESQWERNMGRAPGQVSVPVESPAEFEELWQSDPILDSGMFGSNDD